MAVNENEMIEKARQLAEGDIKIWKICMDMAKWVIENRPVIDDEKDDTDWKAVAQQLRNQLSIVNSQNTQLKELVSQAFYLMQDPKARWDAWLTNVIPMIEKKKKK